MKQWYRLPRHPILWFGGLILLLVLLLAETATPSGPIQWVRVKWVADGDTIILRDGRHIRYIGIDAPETEHHHQPGEPMAKWARATHRQLVEGWRLRLVFDRQATDRYGRSLAYVYRSDGMLVNAALIEKGCAHVLYQWPNVSQAKRLLTAQREAMQKGVGIWQDVEKDASPTHPYRGNRRSKRFHRHDCARGKTMAPKNQIWLKNRWEAFWKGYAPARGCIDFP